MTLEEAKKIVHADFCPVCGEPADLPADAEWTEEMCPHKTEAIDLVLRVEPEWMVGYHFTRDELEKLRESTEREVIGRLK